MRKKSQNASQIKQLPQTKMKPLTKQVGFMIFEIYITPVFNSNFKIIKLILDHQSIARIKFI